MMKKLISLLLVCFLICFFPISVFASEGTQALLDYVTDDAGLLTDDEWITLEKMAQVYSESLQCGLYVVAVDDYTSVADGDCHDVADSIYRDYLLGFGPQRDGVMLLLSANDGNCALICQGLAEDALSGQQQLLLDNAVGAYDTGGYAAIVSTYLTQAYGLIGNYDPNAVFEEPSTAAMTDGYVTDLCGLLTPEQQSALEARAKAVSKSYNRGVYIIAVDDYTLYGDGDLYTTAGDIYLSCNLGLGEYRDGLLLMLSMKQRQVALITHDGSEQFITAEGKDWLASKYLEHFREDQWYEGLEAYIQNSETLLEMAENDAPMTAKTQPGVPLVSLIVSLILGLLIAVIIVAVMKSQLKSVRTAATASGYVAQGGVNITRRSDRFIRRQTTTRIIETKSSDRGGSSGGSRNTDSRGFSGRTDRF